jgi:ATP-dependent 26S proteasome regulatory subunit
MVSTPSAQMVEALNQIKLDKLIIFEEFATAVNNDSKIASMLNFLDGDNSLTDAFFIITTNHPEIIPRNILRPSRVDKFIKIDRLSLTDISNFLNFYLKREILPEEIALMKSQSLANLREICISSLKESKSLSEAVKLLKTREELLKKDFASEKKVGLVNNDDYPDDY